MGQRHLTLDRREILARLLEQGHSLRSAANILGYSPSAISQELKRTGVDGAYAQYSHKKAQWLATLRRRRASQTGKHFSDALLAFVRQGLSLFWSPEQIEGRLKLEFQDDLSMRISFKTIYRWLRQAAESKKPHPWRPYVGVLRLKRRGKCFGRKAYDRRGARSDLTSIETRPETVRMRSRFGDWECDLLRGYKSQGYMVTLVERSTGLVLAQPCATKQAHAVNAAICACLQTVNKAQVHTITVDRGKEFYGYEELERQLKTRVYFCHPHCPNERGQNEQANGLLRQFFPKRKPLSGVSVEQVNRAVALINNRPKKKFGYRTTMELISERGLTRVLSFA